MTYGKCQPIYWPTLPRTLANNVADPAVVKEGTEKHGIYEAAFDGNFYELF